MPRTLSTKRLTLREFRADDAQAIARFVGDLDVARWLTRVPHPYSEEDARSFVSRTSGAPFFYAITRQDAFLGTISIEDELGYWLGKPYWGQGIATEAAHAIVADYFETKGGGIRSGYVIGNHPSRRILDKLGFAEQGVEETPSAALGQPVPVQKMYLTRENWMRQQ